MAEYEHRDEAGVVDERVQVADGSREQVRLTGLADLGHWRRTDTPPVEEAPPEIVLTNEPNVEPAETKPAETGLGADAPARPRPQPPRQPARRAPSSRAPERTP